MRDILSIYGSKRRRQYGNDLTSFVSVLSKEERIISKNKWRFLIGPFSMQLRVLNFCQNKHSIGVKYPLNRPKKACEKALVSVQ